MQPERKRLRFTGSTGHEIAARLDLPTGTPRAFVLFAHCFTCTKDLKAVNWIARELVDRRLALFRFDFTGLGESAGDFAETGFTSNLADLLAATNYLRTQYRAPALLVGHSLGGTAVLAVAGQVPECVGVATIAAPSETAHLIEFLSRQTPPGFGPEDIAQVDVMGRPVRIKGQLLDDLRQHDVAAAVRGLDRPLLIMHSPDDEVVDIAHAQRLFELARHPKSFIALEGADHLLIARETDARYVAAVLATWAEHYLTRATGHGGSTGNRGL